MGKVPNDLIHAKVINGQFLKMKVVNKLGDPCQKLCELIQIPSFFIMFTELFKMATKQILSVNFKEFYLIRYLRIVIENILQCFPALQRKS